MLAVSGALIGFTISLFLPHRYKSRAELVFVAKTDARKLFDSTVELTLLPQSIELIVRRSPYFKERLYVEPMSEVLEDVRKNLSVTAISASGQRGARIEFEDDDADTALDVTKDVLSQMGENAARVSATKKASDVVRIVSTPRVGLTGLTPAILAGLGLAAGLLAGFVVRILAPKN
jgi:hypothetical protein